MTGPSRTEGLTKNFGGVVATDDVELDVPGGRIALHHRPERCRQIDAVRSAMRHPPTRCRPHIASRATTSRRLLAFRRVRRGIGLTFQTNRAYHA